MVTDIRIYVAIGLFMIACISLMIFNFIVIRYSRARHTPSARKVEKWLTILYTESIITGHVNSESPKHNKFLLKRLPKTRHLITYSRALQTLKTNFPKAYTEYVKNRYEVFRKLAYIYRRKSRVERTCFTDFISNFPELVGDSYGQLADSFISYINDSGIHCRTKVISALCSIGSVQGVFNVLQVVNDKSLFMHSHLLTIELSKFRGDKEELASHLWNDGRHWNSDLRVSIVQYITDFSNQYTEIFLSALQDKSLNTEVRAAIIRYYKKYAYDPIRPILIEFIYNHKNIDLSIEAASALSKYPAPETVEALKNALSNPEWHIRYNAAASLLKAGDRDDILQVLKSDSVYKREIVKYMLEIEAAMRNVGTQLNMFYEELGI